MRRKTLDFEFSDLHRSVRAMMKDFVDREVRPIAMEYEHDQRVRELLELIQQAGRLPPYAP